MTPFCAFQRSSAVTGGIQFSRVKRTARQTRSFPWKGRSNFKVILLKYHHLHLKDVLWTFVVEAQTIYREKFSVSRGNAEESSSLLP